MTQERHPARARREDSALILVDCQERLFPVIADAELLAQRLQILLRGAVLLGVPILVTEQYKKGLGDTLPDLLACVGSARSVEKSTFSCLGEPDVLAWVRAQERSHLFLAGIETHVCVAQTALDGLAEGYDVHLIEDASGSRKERDRALGVARMAAAGVWRTSVEAALFDWLVRCDDPQFKAVQGLLR